jgi:hypothetical protein
MGYNKLLNYTRILFIAGGLGYLTAEKSLNYVIIRLGFYNDFNSKGVRTLHLAPEQNFYANISARDWHDVKDIQLFYNGTNILNEKEGWHNPRRAFKFPITAPQKTGTYELEAIVLDKRKDTRKAIARIYVENPGKNSANTQKTKQ